MNIDKDTEKLIKMLSEKEFKPIRLKNSDGPIDMEFLNSMSRKFDSTAEHLLNFKDDEENE